LVGLSGILIGLSQGLYLHKTKQRTEVPKDFDKLNWT